MAPHGIHLRVLPGYFNWRLEAVRHFQTLVHPLQCRPCAPPRQEIKLYVVQYVASNQTMLTT
jgi:hypothetical protein